MLSIVALHQTDDKMVEAAQNEDKKASEGANPTLRKMAYLSVSTRLSVLRDEKGVGWGLLYTGGRTD